MRGRRCAPPLSEHELPVVRPGGRQRGQDRRGIERAQRLRKAADFQRVRARRRSWAHPLLVLYAAPHEGERGPSRSGFVVGRRVGNAVVRNRVKRRLREAVRARYPALVPGVDLVWSARPAIAAADFAAIAASVDGLLRRARLLRDVKPGQVGPGSERAAERGARRRPPAGPADSAALTT